MTAPIPVPRAAPGTPPAPRYPHIRVDLLDVDPAQYVTVVRVALQHGGATAGDVDDFLESATADGADVLTLAARYVAADWRALALVDLARHAEDMPGPVVYRRARAATSMTDDEFDTVLADFVDAQHMLDDLDAGTLNPAVVLDDQWDGRDPVAAARVVLLSDRDRTLNRLVGGV